MTTSVKFSHPHFPDGTPFGVYPFGELENNGAAVEVSEEQEQRFLEENDGKGIEEVFANDATLSVEGGAAKPNKPKAAATTPSFLEENKTEGGEK